MTIQTDRCCDACYNSHGDCIEHGSCLCHAGDTAYLMLGASALGASAIETIRSGAAWSDPDSACSIKGGLLTVRYPEGTERARAVLEAKPAWLGIDLTLGAWVPA